MESSAWPKPPATDGYFAVCQDTEGNAFGLWQSDATAKCRPRTRPLVRCISKQENHNYENIQNMNTQKQNGYMLLFRSDEWYEELSHDEIQRVISQNNDWIEGLIAQGKAKPGHALQRNGATVSGKNGRTVSDGPFAESKEVIGGFLLLDVERSPKPLPLPKAVRRLRMALQSKSVRGEECPLDVRARELARKEQLVNCLNSKDSRSTFNHQHRI